MLHIFTEQDFSSPDVCSMDDEGVPEGDFVLAVQFNGMDNILSRERYNAERSHKFDLFFCVDCLHAKFFRRYGEIFL